MSCHAYLMRRACYRGESCDWEGPKVAHWDKGEISEWAFSKVKESYDKVATEDIGRLSIGQDILRKSTVFLEKNHCACVIGGRASASDSGAERGN